MSVALAWRRKGWPTVTKAGGASEMTGGWSATTVTVLVLVAVLPEVSRAGASKVNVVPGATRGVGRSKR